MRSIQQISISYNSLEIPPTSFFTQIINNIKLYNQRINAYVHLDLEQAERKVKLANSIFSDDSKKAKILEGIFFNVKDSFITKNIPSTVGSSEYKNFVPTSNAPILNKFEELGAIFLGKTNVPEKALDVQTFNSLYGKTNNPWNIEYSPGGSTGGGAASVISEMTQIAVGTDFAGSIRIPSHFCGVSGYIPTNTDKSLLHGSYPHGFDQTFEKFYVGAVGFLSNNITDFNVIFDHIISCKQNTGQSNIRDIIIIFDDSQITISNETKKAMNLLIDVIKNMQDYQIEIKELSETDIPFTEMNRLHPKLMDLTFNSNSKLNKDQILTSKNDFILNLDNYLRDKILIMPICLTNAIKHNLDHKPITVDGKPYSYWKLIHYSRPFNVTENPIITIPVGLGEISQLPISVQLISSRNNDKVLLEFATKVKLLLDKTSLLSKFQTKFILT